MKNSISLMALGIMFAGSVLADSATNDMEQQKSQIQMQNETSKRGAYEGLGPRGMVRTMPAEDKAVTVHNTNDLVGMPLDDKKQDSSIIGSDHIIEMNDTDQR